MGSETLAFGLEHEGRQREGGGKYVACGCVGGLATEARDREVMSVVFPYANVVLDGAAVAAVWATSGAIGAMLGNFAAVAERKSRKERQDWTSVGWAMGCAFGFLLMLCAVVALTRP